MALLGGNVDGQVVEVVNEFFLSLIHISTGMVFTDKTADLLPANAATTAYQYNITPEYLRAASTGCLLYTSRCV